MLGESDFSSDSCVQLAIYPVFPVKVDDGHHPLSADSILSSTSGRVTTSALRARIVQAASDKSRVAIKISFETAQSYATRKNLLGETLDLWNTSQSVKHDRHPFFEDNSWLLDEHAQQYGRDGMVEEERRRARLLLSEGSAFPAAAAPSGSPPLDSSDDYPKKCLNLKCDQWLEQSDRRCPRRGCGFPAPKCNFCPTCDTMYDPNTMDLCRFCEEDLPHTERAMQMSALCSRVLRQTTPQEVETASDGKKDISIISRDTVIKRMRTSSGSLGPSPEAKSWHVKSCADLLQYLIRLSSAAAHEPHNVMFLQGYKGHLSYRILFLLSQGKLGLGGLHFCEALPVEMAARRVFFKPGSEKSTKAPRAWPKLATIELVERCADSYAALVSVLNSTIGNDIKFGVRVLAAYHKSLSATPHKQSRCMPLSLIPDMLDSHLHDIDGVAEDLNDPRASIQDIKRRHTRLSVPSVKTQHPRLQLLFSRQV